METLNEEILELIAKRLRAMSDPTRLRILQSLRDTELSVGEVAERIGMKHGTASANLNAMRKAGILRARRDGNKILYRIGSDMVFSICDSVCSSLRGELAEMSRLRQNLQF